MTYAQLRSDIADWLDREDLSSQIVTFIRMAEAEFNREILVPEREQISSSLTDGATLALPNDFYAMRSLYLDWDYKVPLQQMGITQMRATYASDDEGLPRHFAMQANELVFGPTPDDEYSIILNYYQSIPALSDDNETNWLLDAHPDVYMAAAQWQANIFLRDWTAAAYFKAETDRLIDRIKQSGILKATGTPLAAVGPVLNIWGVQA